MDHKIIPEELNELEIPEDETHRFLKWQASKFDCWEWKEHFEAAGVNYKLSKSDKGWTIYKHMLKAPNYMSAGKEAYYWSWCCGTGEAGSRQGN